MGAEGERWQQVARGRTAANQAVHAGRSHPALRARVGREAREAACRHGAERMSPDETGKVAAAGRRALVVDDERLIRWSLAQTLSDRGFTVAEAEDGKGAVRALTGNAAPPDLVLLDFRLPDSNDLDLLSRIISLVP